MKNRGITLIALIVTIILLLILSGVVINLALGEHGIIGMAKQAGEEYKIASIKERVEQEILVLDADKTTKGETLTVEQALIELEKKETFSEIDLAEETGICEGYLIKLGYDEFGNVVIEGISKETGTRLVTEVTPKGYTKEDVIVAISIKPDTVKISNIEVPDGMTKQEDGTYKIAKDGTYHVKVILEEGEPIEKDIKIDTIDKLPPKDFGITAEGTMDKLIISAQTQDQEQTLDSACSGIDRYEYVVIDKDGKETTYTESEIKGLRVGTYQIYAIAYDKVGNPKQTETITAEVKIRVSDVYAGYLFSVVTDEVGRMWAWGENSNGELRDGTTIDKIKPEMTDWPEYKTIATKGRFILAINQDDNLWGWGWNEYGQLGDGTTTDRTTPVQIKEGTKFKKISAGLIHSIGIDTDGNLWSWGSNEYGQVGDETTTERITPVQIKEGTKFKEVVTGQLSSFAIDVDGNLWGWGWNEYGQLGDGTTTDRTTPVQIKEGTKFKKISAGDGYSLAIDTDGNLWGWGYNKIGQVGDGTTTDRTTPVQIKEGTKFKKISAGDGYSLAIDTDGNLWAWGRNNYGQLGDGTTTNRTTPVQIKEGTKFKEVAGGNNNSFGIDTDGNLWAWGYNGNGLLGDGTTTNKTTPIRINLE